MLPHPSAFARNPAYIVYPDRTGFDEGFQMPIGLLGFLVPKRNPFLYFTDRDTFRRSFDLLSFFNQAMHPYSLLFNAAKSTREIIFRIEQGNIRMTDENENPLLFRSVVGARGMSVGGTPLIPPPLIYLPIEIKPVYLRTGLFMGSGGFALEPNAQLRTALETTAISPDTTYAVSDSTAIQAGLSQSVTLASRFYPAESSHVLYLAVRLLPYYMAAYGQADFSAATRTNAGRLPESTSFEGSLFYLYPSKGGGTGVRADAGVVLDAGRFTFGMGVLNLAGLSYLTGYEQDYTSAGGERLTERAFYRLYPEVFINCGYRLPLGSAMILLAADLGYAEQLYFHGGIALFYGALFIHCGFGFGLRMGRFSTEIGITFHEAPFVGFPVFGLALNFGIAAQGAADSEEIP